MPTWAIKRLSEIPIIKKIVKENLGLSRTFIYEKSDEGPDKEVIRRPNRGREQEAFAYHVYTHYDNLADKVVFVPANIQKHPERLQWLFNCANTPGISQSETLDMIRDFKLDSHENRPLQPAEPRGLKNWVIEHLGEKFWNDYRTSRVTYTGCFSTTREKIHKNPREVYKLMLELAGRSEEPECSHYLERIMGSLYGG